MDARDTGRERDREMEGREGGREGKERVREGMNDCLKAGSTSFTSSTLRSPFTIGRDLLEETAGWLEPGGFGEG